MKSISQILLETPSIKPPEVIRGDYQIISTVEIAEFLLAAGWEIYSSQEENAKANRKGTQKHEVIFTRDWDGFPSNIQPAISIQNSYNKESSLHLNFGIKSPPNITNLGVLTKSQIMIANCKRIPKFSMDHRISSVASPRNIQEVSGYAKDLIAVVRELQTGWISRTVFAELLEKASALRWKNSTNLVIPSMPPDRGMSALETLIFLHTSFIDGGWQHSAPWLRERGGIRTVRPLTNIKHKYKLSKALWKIVWSTFKNEPESSTDADLDDDSSSYIDVTNEVMHP